MSQRSDGNTNPIVYVVDDDAGFCEWMSAVLASINVQVKIYQTPSTFLAEVSEDCPSCVLLDVRLPEMSGMVVQQKLLEKGLQIPVIMITAYGDVSDAVEAIKTGAVDYVQKPISRDGLMERVQRGLELSRTRLQSKTDLQSISNQFVTLSSREVEVLELLVEGQTTKQIASKLGIGLTTVDFHRHNLLEKMQVDNLVELTHKMEQFDRLKEDVNG